MTDKLTPEQLAAILDTIVDAAPGWWFDAADTECMLMFKSGEDRDRFLEAFHSERLT